MMFEELVTVCFISSKTMNHLHEVKTLIVFVSCPITKARMELNIFLFNYWNL